MTDRERELINRYIYEVTRRVPKGQRDEIELELRELIDDMMEGLTLEQVFAKLGDPAAFARKYREDKNYVISPEYYDNYTWVLKIVMICIWVGLFISMAVRCLIDYRDIPYEIVRLISGMMTASLTGFGAVTFVFAFMERQKIKVDLKQGKAWNCEMLRPVPDKKAKISRGECAASIIFIIIFCCLLIFAPQRLGAYSVRDNEILYVSIFNMQKWDIILPVFLISMAVGFVDEIIKLVSGCYSKAVMMSSIVTNCLQLVLSVIILKVLPFWNPNFIQEVQVQFDDIFHFKNEVIRYWNTGLLSDIILGIIVFASVLEVGTTVYRTLRYGREFL